jgi:hypothetical protein
VLNLVSEDATDPRENRRSNVFLAATLLAAGVSHAVRVRNISETGALLDGPTLPSEGATINLRRGSLSADGEVAWQKKGQCGVRFGASVVVSDWVKRIEHGGQARVDQMVALVRNLPGSSPGRPTLAHVETEDSLQSISADLVKVCERLASVHVIVAEHGEELLQLDAIAQRIRHLLTELDG